MKDLTNIGCSDWFQSRIDNEKAELHSIARVISVHKDSYIISKGEGNVYAELSGNLSYTVDSATELPTTGDWIYADFYDDDTHAIIHGVFPRKSLLKRKTAGKLVDYQLIAANIDVAFIIQSANENFNLRRLERYLVMVNESGIDPIILLSKSDLASEQQLSEIKQSISEIAPQTTIITFSNISSEHLDSIKNRLEKGRSYCLLGSSGVGKTTLLNSILGDDQFETQSVSKKESKGRHTTTSRELVQLENGAMIIDTPGMRELGNMSVDSGLDETFAEIIELSQHCKFSNCSHTKEKGCAIQTAINDGELSEERYKNYQKMKNESAFYDMSYAEKRKKDKAFGKMVRATIKGNPRR